MKIYSSLTKCLFPVLETRKQTKRSKIAEVKNQSMLVVKSNLGGQEAV